MTRLSANEMMLMRAAGPQVVQVLATSLSVAAGRRMLSEAELERQMHQSRPRASAKSPKGGVIGRFLRGLVAGVKTARRRNDAVTQLRRLDDRLLNDIGLQRGLIEEAVDATMEKRAPSWALDGLSGIGKAIFNPLVRPVLRWRREAITLGELSQLDDHLLEDIGVTRGDLRHAPETVLARAEDRRPANRNSRGRHAA